MRAIDYDEFWHMCCNFCEPPEMKIDFSRDERGAPIRARLFLFLIAMLDDQREKICFMLESSTIAVLDAERNNKPAMKLSYRSYCRPFKDGKGLSLLPDHRDRILQKIGEMMHKRLVKEIKDEVLKFLKSGAMQVHTVQ